MSKVYGFDSSPVTGYFSVNKATWELNRKNLAIDRIYERREILAILRSTVNLVNPPSRVDPQIREIRFNIKQNWNRVIRHSITDLRENLQLIAEGKWAAPYPH